MDTFARAVRLASHSIFLLVLIIATVVATTQLTQQLSSAAPRSTDATASTVQRQAADPGKPGGLALMASLVKVHVDDNVIRRSFVPTSGSSDPAAPGNEKTAPRSLLTYTVQSGDTLFDIASAFGLAPETLLWSNYRVLKDNPELLSIGLELIIQPSDGLLTEPEEGDTVELIARRFKVTPQAILTEPLNVLTDVNQALTAGKQLFVPGGKRELVIWEVPKPVEVRRSVTTGVRVFSVGTCGEIAIPALGTGDFEYPTGRGAVSGYDFTSTHPGVDFTGSMGDNI